MKLKHGEFNLVIDDSVLSKRDRQAIAAKEQIYSNQWRKLFGAGDVVYDIGAYIGIVSACLCFEGAIVHSFEGSPNNCGRFKTVCRSLSNVTLHPYALHVKKGKFKTRFNDCIGREHPEQEIEYVILSEYVLEKQIPPPRFIKIDIEGMESVILSDLFPSLNQYRPCWQIEWHKGIQFKYSEFPGFVENGFDFNTFCDAEYDIYDVAWVAKDPSQFEIYCNYFFVPRELNRIKFA